MKYILPSGFFIALLVAWEIGVSVFHIEKWLLPAPSVIVSAFIENKELIFGHSLQTIFETFVGLSLAVIFAVVIAILVEWAAVIRNLIRPLVVISQTIPFIVLAPLLTIWLGYGILPKIAVIVLACFFPIVISLLDGFRSADRNMIRLLQTMGASKRQLFSKVIFPASLPYFFSGLRVSGTYAVGIAVVSEWLGAEKGLGILLLRSAKSYQTDTLFAAIIVIAILSLMTVLLIEGIARKSLPWYYLEKRSIQV